MADKKITVRDLFEEIRWAETYLLEFRSRLAGIDEHNSSKTEETLYKETDTFEIAIKDARQIKKSMEFLLKFVYQTEV